MITYRVNATYVTWPIPIASDRFWPFPITSDHFRPFPRFLVISDDFYFWPTSSACCGSQFSTAQHPGSSVHNYWGHRQSGYQKREAASAYRFGPTSAWWFGDITIVTQARNRCYELDMVILKVGLCASLRSFVQAVKFINCHPFHLKFSHYYILPCTYKKKK